MQATRGLENANGRGGTAPSMIHAHSPVIVEKKRLRVRARAARAGAFAASGVGAGERLAALAAGLPPGLVAGYWPMSEEIDPRPLLAELARLGRALALPVVVERDRHLDFRTWSPGDELEPGDHGTFHPFASAPLVIPDVVLVPLLAFDRRGYRLGYGGGYYDRTLEGLRRAAHVTTIGVAFAAQEVAAVPHDGHDQRLDWVATEAGLIEVMAE